MDELRRDKDDDFEDPLKVIRLPQKRENRIERKAKEAVNLFFYDIDNFFYEKADELISYARVSVENEKFDIKNTDNVNTLNDSSTKVYYEDLLKDLNLDPKVVEKYFYFDSNKYKKVHDGYIFERKDLSLKS